MLSEVFKYLFLDGNIMQLSEWHELIKIIHKQLSSYVMSFVLGMRDIKMNRTLSLGKADKEFNQYLTGEGCSYRGMHRELKAREGDRNQPEDIRTHSQRKRLLS